MEDSRASGRDSAERDLDCQIFVAASSRDRLMERVASTLRVALGADQVMTFGCVDVEWEHNDYEGTGARDEFLDWHSLLACQPRRGAASTDVVSDMSTILEAIREAGYRAVPVCDYEELLPEPGAGLVQSDSPAPGWPSLRQEATQGGVAERELGNPTQRRSS